MKLRAFLIYQEMLGIGETQNLLRGMVTLPLDVHAVPGCSIVSLLPDCFSFKEKLEIWYFFSCYLYRFEIVN